MSSCNRDHTHYDFLCQALKVVENDKAIARSVTFRVGPVPMMWLPFYVFPLTQGRRSGILTPRIGSNSRDGITVSNIGYYWAPSDYWDATLKTALRERNGFLFDAGIDYAVRRRLSGYMNLSLERGRRPSGDSHRAWRLNFHHQHRLNPTLNIRARGDFTNSSSFDLHNSNNLYRYLNRQLRSSFSMDKRWTEARRSMDINLNYYRDLDQNQNRFQGLPRLSFRQGRRRVFGQPETTREAQWYHAFYYDLSGGLTNAFTRNEDPADDTHNLTLNSRFGLSGQHRPFGWLDLAHRVNLSQTSSRPQDARTRRESYNASLAAGTALYGIFKPHVGRLRGIRHRFQPQIDFRYSRSARVEGATLGFHGRRDWNEPRRTLNMRLNNTIEIKTEVGRQSEAVHIRYGESLNRIRLRHQSDAAMARSAHFGFDKACPPDRRSPQYVPHVLRCGGPSEPVSPATARPHRQHQPPLQRTDRSGIRSAPNPQIHAALRR